METYTSKTGRKFDDRGLLLPPNNTEHLMELADNQPPDDEVDKALSYEYIKPAKNPDVFGSDLATELVVVKDTGKESVGRGLFARKKIDAGQDIFEFDGMRRGEKKGLPPAIDGYSAHAVVVGSSREAQHYFVYVVPNGQSPLRYLNHSCNPNARRKPNDTFGFVALRDIEPGEEITADYSLLEANPYWRLENCGCGSDNCRHTIESASSLPLTYLMKNWDVLTPEMQVFAIEFSRDPQISEARNQMGADQILGGKSPLRQKHTINQILESKHPTIVRERNHLGAKKLAPVFLKKFSK